jgi:hypothetical protein
VNEEERWNQARCKTLEGKYAMTKKKIIKFEDKTSESGWQNYEA